MLTLGGPALFSSDSQQVKTSSQLAGRRAAEVSSKSASVKSIDTILAHAGVEDIPNAPMSPPLSLSTTFSRPPDGVYRDEDWIYSRHGSPTKYLLETTIAALECHGDDRPYDDAVCCAVSSGMAGVNTIITAHGSSTCVLIPHDLYHGVPTLLEDVLRNLGITYERVVFQNVDDVVEKVSQVSAERAVVWMETPSNPQCQVIDIKSICSALKATNTRAKVTTVVDSTMATPCLTQPLRVSESMRKDDCNQRHYAIEASRLSLLNHLPRF
jgi:cystathionine beta-lyase/cystathionine gamma-synthase